MDCSKKCRKILKEKEYVIFFLVHFDSGMYYFVNMVLTATSIIIGTIVVNIARNNKSKPPVPKVIRFVSMQSSLILPKVKPRVYTSVCRTLFILLKSQCTASVFLLMIYLLQHIYEKSFSVARYLIRPCKTTSADKIFFCKNQPNIFPLFS